MRLFPLLLCFLLSCSFSGQGLEEEELDIVLPTKERVNKESMIIAHQGAWREAGLLENSLAAFQKALDLDIYGSECDVQQTKDGRFVICHDDTYCGFVISETNYAILSECPLKNGELLPLLGDFLNLLNKDEGRVRLILDLKSCDVAKLLNMIYAYGVLDRVDFLTGNSKIFSRLVKYGLGYKTFFLGGGMTPQSAMKKGLGGIDYSDQVLSTHPEWITEAQALGLKVWVWTVNDAVTIRKYLEQGVFVTTDRPEMALNIEY